MEDKNIKFELKQVSENEVRGIVNKLKSKKSSGHDGLSSEVLKLCGEEIIPPLTSIINKSIESRTFPEEWKYSKVVPLHKKGDRKSLPNYRPVSLLPVAGMVLEKCVSTQIYEYFEENDLFGHFQFGFRKGKSCISELLTLMDHLLEAKEMKKEIALILYDLSAAFDTISHDILIEKFKLYGFQEGAIQWITSYLKNRRQSVVIDGKVSASVDIKVGTPQGSRISPLLFICLMADLDLYTDQSLLSNFADDTQSVIIADTEEQVKEIAKKEANSVIDFFRSNDLVNNATKAALLMNSKGKSLEASISDIGGTILKSKSSEKLLGLHVSSSLDWKDHVEKLSVELRKRIGLLRRIKNKVTHDKLRIIAEALFNSKCRYGIAVYLTPVYDEEDLKMEMLPPETEKLQTLQNSMLRTIYGLPPSQHTNMKKLRLSLKMMSINQMSVYHTLIETYNVIRNSSSEHLKEKLLPKADNKGYGLRG